LDTVLAKEKRAELLAEANQTWATRDANARVQGAPREIC
jgi:hypothetical protein